MRYQDSAKVCFYNYCRDFGYEDRKSSFFEPENNTKTKYVKITLFPYRYYLCSIFIKKLDIS